MFTTIDTGSGPVVVHLNVVTPARVVPGPLRHKWSRKPERGQTATCSKCGCQKCYRTDYTTVYRLKGSAAVLDERPDCTPPTPSR